MNDQLQATTGSRSRDPIEGWLAGRANRMEYWLFVAPIVALLVGWGVFSLPGSTLVTLIAGLAMLFIWIRRLHDLGFSGWIALLIAIATRVVGFALGALLPADAAVLGGLAVSSVAVLVLGAWPGQAHDNRYGPPRMRRANVADTFN